MALIDYKCKDCKNEFFEIVNDANEKIKCPKCNSTNIERLYKGKYYGKSSGNCSHDCGSCSGCH
ncbi:MAG TPA: zinc ribbon domain-containing protein [Clostridiaceae bacterium]|jgi:putative FmdB family regulatory protein|nr:zinc ribbon domain-containing protein [Clostridiaceae bacterium]HBF77685.1 zinc ribbon domain-containing protein [Clostridiaceae bacterium]HBG39608.1 zinc ribbon domain-containing protein [Clostridiaceae bacterium]HBN28901.1 zinc ribbon domain-containing protein [Clostridiaceae bacterium]HBX49207.1 zinc ribbon domain-containing protein [Clostridiaceae bacterium]